MHHSVRVFAFERRKVVDDHIQNNTNRPYIAFFIISSSKNFWSNIVGSPNSRSQRFIQLQLRGNTKINDLNQSSRFLKQHVFRFDIPVNNPFGMKIMECTQYLFHYTFCLVFTDTMIDNSFKQLSAFTELQYEDIAVFLVIYFVQLCYVWVIHVHHQCHFSKQVFMFV